MKTEISKGTQKFIWHLVAFAAVFVLALVVICRVLPEPNSTSTVDQNARVTTYQTEENFSTDFNSVKERVDQANNTTGKEVKSLYLQIAVPNGRWCGGQRPLCGPAARAEIIV